MTDKIISLIEKSEDSNHWSVEDALKEALRLIQSQESGFGKCSKVVILGLDSKDGNYNVNFVRAGVKSSDCISICRVAETIFLKEMDYIS